MICHHCGNCIKKDFANFCDSCGMDLRVRIKKTISSVKQETHIIEEVERASNLFLLWNVNILAAFIFYIIYITMDSYAFLFLLTLFMLVLSWMLLLMKLHDLTIRQNLSSKKFILMNFGAPVLGTFYYFLNLTHKNTSQ